jgi:TonB family protein
MKPESKHTSWLTLLLRWLSSDATRRDEQALEAIAKDEPFVAEALEGYRSLPEDDHALAVTRLKARLRQRYGKKRRGVVFYAVRAAAVGVVLVAAWLVLQQFNQPEMDRGSMAEVATEEAPVPADTGTTATKSVISDPAKEEGATADIAAGRQKERPPGPEAQPSKEEVLPPKAVAENETSPKVKGSELAVISTFADSTVSLARADTAPAAGMVMEDEAAAPAAPPAERIELKNESRHIAGRVTDASGEPLIGVSVFDESSNSGAVTDVDGNFSIEVGDSSQMLAISYTGYENRKIRFSPEAFVEVQLKESEEQLSEVTVTGLKARKAKKRDARASAAPAPPLPKGGFKKFKKYLRKNLRYPEAAVQNSVEGAVMLRFRVADDGSLTDFEVLNSLGSGCDEEAIRLLKEGPKWAPAGVVTYFIEFKF